jgi:hypothetical protein
MTHMRHCPPLDPDVSDTAPFDPALAVYDEEHLITYLRLLDADAEGADWREVARIVPHIDPQHESDRARRAFYSRLSRASELLQSPRSGTTSRRASDRPLERPTTVANEPDVARNGEHLRGQELL